MMQMLFYFLVVVSWFVLLVGLDTLFVTALTDTTDDSNCNHPPCNIVNCLSSFANTAEARIRANYISFHSCYSYNVVKILMLSTWSWKVIFRLSVQLQISSLLRILKQLLLAFLLFSYLKIHCFSWGCR